MMLFVSFHTNETIASLLDYDLGCFNSLLSALCKLLAKEERRLFQMHLLAAQGTSDGIKKYTNALTTAIRQSPAPAPRTMPANGADLNTEAGRAELFKQLGIPVRG